MALSHYKITNKKTGKILSEGDVSGLQEALAEIVIEKAPDKETGVWELRHLYEDFLECIAGVVKGYDLSIEIKMG